MIELVLVACLLKDPARCEIPPAPDRAHEPRRVHGHRPALSRALDRAAPSLARSALELRLPARLTSFIRSVGPAGPGARGGQRPASPPPAAPRPAKAPPPARCRPGRPPAPRCPARPGRRPTPASAWRPGSPPAPMPTTTAAAAARGAGGKCLQPAPAGGDMALEQAQPVERARRHRERRPAAGSAPGCDDRSPIHQRVEAADARAGHSRQRRRAAARKRSPGTSAGAAAAAVPIAAASGVGSVHCSLSGEHHGLAAVAQHQHRDGPAVHSALIVGVAARPRPAEAGRTCPPPAPARRLTSQPDRSSGGCVLDVRMRQARGLRAAPRSRTDPWRAGSRPVPCPAARPPAPGPPGGRDDARSPSRRRAAIGGGASLPRRLEQRLADKRQSPSTGTRSSAGCRFPRVEIAEGVEHDREQARGAGRLRPGARPERPTIRTGSAATHAGVRRAVEAPRRCRYSAAARRRCIEARSSCSVLNFTLPTASAPTPTADVPSIGVPSAKASSPSRPAGGTALTSSATSRLLAAGELLLARGSARRRGRRPGSTSASGRGRRVLRLVAAVGRPQRDAEPLAELVGTRR